MQLFEHHFDSWKEDTARPTGRYRVRTTWYGRLVMQVEELVAYSRTPSVHFTNTKTETRWRDMTKAETRGKHFVCLQ